MYIWGLIGGIWGLIVYMFVLLFLDNHGWQTFVMIKVAQLQEYFVRNTGGRLPRGCNGQSQNNDELSGNTNNDLIGLERFLASRRPIMTLAARRRPINARGRRQLEVRVSCAPLPSYVVNTALIQNPWAIIHNYSSRLCDATGNHDFWRRGKGGGEGEGKGSSRPTPLTWTATSYSFSVEKCLFFRNSCQVRRQYRPSPRIPHPLR